MNRSLHIHLVSACLATCLLVSLASPVTSASAVEAQAMPTFTIRGTGFGHGIGMSQYGAQGSALAGKDYRWILGRYYTGTTVSTAPAKTIRVNIDAAANYNSGGNAGFTKTSWRIRPGQSGQRLVINGVASMDGVYTFAGSGSSIIVTAPNGTRTTLTGPVTANVSGGSPPLLQVVEGTGIYTLTNTKYRGSLVLTASGGRIKLLNVLPMESYLYGVVPRESISSWHRDALRAQAVAARSYAYASSGELYCTTLSQAYQGYGGYSSSNVWVGEMSSTNTAVNDTRNQVVKYGSRVVRTYYFSHSGGHTANVEDVWVPANGDLAAKARQFPELRGVADLYEHLANPPYAPWPASREVTYTGLQMADRLRGLSGVPASPAYVTGVTVERAGSGHARYVTFRFSNGAHVRLTGSTVRSRLGLLSTSFRFSGFPISRIQGANRYATAVAVSSRAFAGTVPAVVVASGQDFADALTGSALAGAAGGPLLLTTSTGVPAVTADELVRLQPARVYVMGGRKAIVPAVVSAIERILPSADVVRVDGADRYDTARKTAVIVSGMGGSSSVIVASGTSWPDAASASALAYARKTPILLTPAGSLDRGTESYLAARLPATVLIVGGTAVISEGVAAEVAAAAGCNPTRLAGPNRYATSAAIARHTIMTAPAFVPDDIYLATGVEYADALTGGTLAGARRRPLLLTHKDVCNSGTASFLQQYDATIARLYLFGGPAAISEKGRDALDEVMMR